MTEGSTETYSYYGPLNSVDVWRVFVCSWLVLTFALVVWC